MNLILLFDEDFVAKDRVYLKGRRFLHIKKIHRASVGDSLCVGMLGGLVGRGEVKRLDGCGLEMEVAFHREPPPALPATLILALPRPKVFKRILLCATSMGVKRMVIINSWRVEKSFWKSPVLHEENLRQQMILGLEQSRDTVLPELWLRPLFKPFVEDELPALAQGTLSIVAHPGGSEPCPRDVDAPVTLAIGPEGGFIDYEVEKLQGLGFSAVNMGPRILRVESAVPALLSRLF